MVVVVVGGVVVVVVVVAVVSCVVVVVVVRINAVVMMVVVVDAVVAVQVEVGYSTDRRCPMAAYPSRWRESGQRLPTESRTQWNPREL